MFRKQIILHLLSTKVICTFFSFPATPRYLNKVYGIKMPPNQKVYCSIYRVVTLTAILSSTWFILSMTFERFYSIIRPHKAASFNTVKRAKISIICIVIFCILYRIPYVFIEGSDFGTTCQVFYPTAFLKFYYWLSFSLAFAVPFISLLFMNSVIIHTLCQRSKLGLLRSTSEGQGQSENQKIKHSEKQIYTTLLFLTFGFLLLNTPVCVWLLLINLYKGKYTPQFQAVVHLSSQIGEKTFYTNNAINFFLYVMSGQKFRTDLTKLFGFGKKQRKLRNQALASISDELTGTTCTQPH